MSGEPLRSVAPGPQLLSSSIADQLHDILCHRIVTGEYLPGQRLDIQAIAEEFAVSKTPVRDAVFELEADRLVETRPRSGTFVTTMTIQDVHEVCQLRKGIEWVATGIAAATMPIEAVEALRIEAVNAERAAREGDFQPFFKSDTNIHTEIVRASSNSRLLQVRSSVQPFIDWLQFIGATGPERVLGSSRRHMEILDAMAKRDADAAAAAAAVHLDEVEEWTAADLRELGYE
ncbi:GntR family transcriptional regulator [Gulosibacter faecalis]|uniref:GntR family transcriptional regulator n=1 Tax=Gulosibacter faecalis TaxID=272240 RepID=A0ABW5UWT7_9MICO|nr:GntR family transcriptional regulator [Gulosibacter faecalis]